MIHRLVERLEVSELKNTEEIKPRHINRRINGEQVKTYREIYEILEKDCLLKQSTMPVSWKNDWANTQANSWQPTDD